MSLFIFNYVERTCMLAKDVPNLVKESFQITAETAGHKISVTSFLRVVASILLSDIYIVLFMLLHTSIHIKIYLHKQYVDFSLLKR